jgi:molybdopterin molybdotransferase
MIPFEEARAKILALGSAVPLGAERVALDDAAGRVLAEDVAAPSDLPRFDYSAMDGYAVRAAEITESALVVAGESKTGVAPSGPLVPGTAWRIFTGAELPQGADAVIMQEDAAREGDHVAFATRPAPWANVRRRAEDLAAGATAIPRGTTLAPRHLALAATCDRAWLEVARRPIVAIVGTGDELRAPGTPDRPGSIPESNAGAVRAMAIAAGAIARVAPFAKDTRPEVERALDEALRAADVLVTIGGVSVGDHDVVRPALEAIGCSIELYKVAIRPGKPLTLGRRGASITLGLPGNPASAMVTFALFGVPLLRALQGAVRPVAAPLPAVLASDVRHAPGRASFLRATLTVEGGRLVASPLANQASGAVTTMAWADALAVVPAAAEQLRAGDAIDVYPLGELGA